MVFQSFSESLHPRADDDFRRDIKRLCSKYEQDYVQVLIRSHKHRRPPFTQKTKKTSSGQQQKTEERCHQKTHFCAPSTQGNCKWKRCNQSIKKDQQEVETTYNRAFLTPLFALIKILRDIWPLQLRKLPYFRPSFFSGEWGILKIPAFKDSRI